MSATSKILGQSKPSAAALATLYTVPTSGQAQGTLSCCNQSLSVDAVRVALIKSGDSVSACPAYSYVCYDTIVPANGVLEKIFDIGTNDSIVIYSTNGTTSFTATGLEIV